MMVIAGAEYVPVEPLDIGDTAAKRERQHDLLQNDRDEIEQRDRLAIAPDARGGRHLDDQAGRAGTLAGAPDDRTVEGNVDQPVPGRDDGERVVGECHGGLQSM